MKNNEESNRRIYKNLSWVCIVLGCLAWVPNLVFHTPTILAFLTMPLGIIALVLSIKSKRVLLVVLSCLVACSFFILMAFGYIVAAILATVNNG